jgi:hypothetical protein
MAGSSSSAYQNEAASPEVTLDVVVHRHDDGNEYLAFHVQQFVETSVICRKNGPDELGQRDRLSAGDFFVRPPGKPQTERITDARAIQELIYRPAGFKS